MRTRSFLVVLGVLAALACQHAAAGVAENPQDSRQAQILLKDLGYDPGPADGVLGPRTHSALEAFQRDNGLPVTGILDEKTAERLGLDLQVPSQAFDTVAAHAILLASLPQSLQRFVNVFSEDDEHTRVAVTQLRMLLADYQMSADSLRSAQVLPSGVRAMFDGKCLVYISDNTWFEPVALVYLAKGAFPEVSFRYPAPTWVGGPPEADRAAGYSLQFSDETYVVVFKDGMEAKTGTKQYVFRGGRWRVVSR